ncbi:MAG TPA: ABC transporter permease [Saprospiraceae bacterium]|nr:ABC transporter permease [Saprospiraceae bacterium]
MSKLSLIIKREYLTRVRKKSFIIGTLLAPVGLLVYMLVIVGLSSYQGGDEIKVAVLDEAKIVGNLPDEKGVRFLPSGNKTLDQLKTEVTEKKIDGVLRVPPVSNFQQKDHTIFYYSDDKLAPEKSGLIEKRIAGKIKEFKMDSLKLDANQLKLLESDVSIDPEGINSNQDDDQSKYTAGVGLAVGGIMTFLLFFMVLMYGQMVMRSVMEEKTNRIVEVMMSSVRPFDLMMGKIIGAGLVGLTQVVAWVVLSGAVSLLVPLVFGGTPVEPPLTPGDATMDPEMVQDTGMRIMTELSKQNWPLLIGSFIIYFLGGYFIYSSMFAAVGSAMGDDLGEGQSLTLPATLPLILAFYIVSMAGWRNPDSGLMVFSSIFPLFSPIAMPFRLAFNPPWWQVAISLVLVVASAIFFVWLAGRIYRVGILMYGKKVTLKEMWKWTFYKG